MLNFINKIFIAWILVISFNSPGFCDSIISETGSIVNGKIHTVVGGLVLIKTKEGLQRVVREVDVGKARDIVETGFLKRKKHVGRVLYKDNEKLEIKTPQGILSIDIYKVRNIILAQDFNISF